MPGVARAPGKLVLTGAYAVLDGAPAIVAAVDRYVTADAGRAGTRVTEEVAAAIAAGELRAAPWFDAMELRVATPDGGSRKLGLGSSAAILVASLGACAPELGDDAALREAVFPRALRAHHAAQAGGSGVDVAASTFGGIVEARSVGGQLRVAQHRLPPGLKVTVYAARHAASTPAFVAQVRALRDRDARAYEAILARLHDAARAAVAADGARAFVDVLAAQYEGLRALGEAAGVPIVPDDAVALAGRARTDGAAFGPSGAGGGDVAVHVGEEAPSAAFEALAAAAALDRLQIRLGAPGLSRVSAGTARGT